MKKTPSNHTDIATQKTFMDWPLEFGFCLITTAGIGSIPNDTDTIVGFCLTNGCPDPYMVRGDERVVIGELLSFLDENPTARLIGYSLLNYDLSFLLYRAEVIHRISIHETLKQELSLKTEGIRFLDISSLCGENKEVLAPSVFRAIVSNGGHNVSATELCELYYKAGKVLGFFSGNHADSRILPTKEMPCATSSEYESPAQYKINAQKLPQLNKYGSRFFQWLVTPLPSLLKNGPVGSGWGKIRQATRQTYPFLEGNMDPSCVRIVGFISSESNMPFFFSENEALCIATGVDALAVMKTQGDIIVANPVEWKKLTVARALKNGVFLSKWMFGRESRKWITPLANSFPMYCQDISSQLTRYCMECGAIDDKRVFQPLVAPLWLGQSYFKEDAVDYLLVVSSFLAKE